MPGLFMSIWICYAKNPARLEFGIKLRSLHWLSTSYQKAVNGVFNPKNCRKILKSLLIKRKKICLLIKY